MLKLLVLLVFYIFYQIEAREENVLLTEVFDISIDPPMFNWTYEGDKNQFVYQASLLNAPDLPSWVNFVYSTRHHAGFLYGVPPNGKNSVSLEVVALNRQNYEVRHEIINIHISEKLNPAKFEVHMKIDNVNVEDMFDVERMDALKDVFRKKLWKDSESDLYLTSLNSALELGARKPLNPNEEEGIVIRLGSQEPFSQELIELQEEIRPLWKVPSCPRDFKRTSVERFFREAGFALDWCSFKLIDDNNAAMAGINEKLSNSKEESEEFWQTISKEEVPERNYSSELLLSTLLPAFIFVILGGILTFILCFHHDALKDEASEEFFDYLYHICSDYFSARGYEEDAGQYSTVQRATQSFLNMSGRECSLSPDPILLSRSHTNSPTSTISRGVHCRPSPPPYVRPKFKPNL